MEIRRAELADLQELLDIYNYEVVNGVATLDIQPKTLEEWSVWFSEHNIENHPLIVAVEDEKVMGYASLSSYRQKEAFKSTVELSVYIAPDCRGRGVATALMTELLDEARRDESIHNVVSVITDGNEDSRKLHEIFNFEFCGRIPAVGMKFGEYRNILNYSLLV